MSLEIRHFKECAVAVYRLPMSPGPTFSDTLTTMIQTFTDILTTLTAVFTGTPTHTETLSYITNAVTVIIYDTPRDILT